MHVQKVMTLGPYHVFSNKSDRRLETISTTGHFGLQDICGISNQEHLLIKKVFEAVGNSVIGMITHHPYYAI
jgi:hypothetical protein